MIHPPPMSPSRLARPARSAGLLAVAVTVGVLFAGCSKADTDSASVTTDDTAATTSTPTTVDTEPEADDTTDTAPVTTDPGTSPQAPPADAGSGKPAAPAKPASPPQAPQAPPAPAPVAPPKPPAPAPPQQGGGGTGGAKPPSGEITMDRAVQIAIGKYGGQVVEVEADSYRGTPTWEVELVNTSLGRIEVHVSRTTGEILKVDDEND